ncbi:lipopolysaccharide heptosyltransferase family protein, partial [Patescibacteria group bacterium]
MLIPQVKNPILVARCFLRFLVYGKANKEINLPESVLIIQLGKFGDMLATTPMFRAVKKTYPACRVTVIGNKVNKELVEGNLDIDEYIVWDNDVDNMISTLKGNSYDFGCVTGPNFHSLAALFLSGIKTISAPVIKNGWSPYETRSYKIIRNFVIKRDHRMRHYVPREYLRLLEPIGIYTEDTKKYIYWSTKGEAKAKEIISEINKPYSWLVGIMPGAGNKAKQWSARRFAKVSDYLVKKYNAYILIIGSEANRKEISEMRNAVIYRDSVTDTSRTSVDEVKALISKLDFT